MGLIKEFDDNFSFFSHFFLIFKQISLCLIIYKLIYYKKLH